MGTSIRLGWYRLRYLSASLLQTLWGSFEWARRYDDRGIHLWLGLCIWGLAGPMVMLLIGAVIHSMFGVSSDALFAAGVVITVAVGGWFVWLTFSPSDWFDTAFDRRTRRTGRLAALAGIVGKISRGGCGAAQHRELRHTLRGDHSAEARRARRSARLLRRRFNDAVADAATHGLVSVKRDSLWVARIEVYDADTDSEVCNDLRTLAARTVGRLGALVDAAEQTSPAAAKSKRRRLLAELDRTEAAERIAATALAASTEQATYVALSGYAGSLNHAVAGVPGASRVQGGEGRVVRHRTSPPSALVVHPGR